MPEPITIFIFVVALIGFLGTLQASKSQSNSMESEIPTTKIPTTKNDLIKYFEASIANADDKNKEKLEKALSYINDLPDQVSETKIKRLFEMGNNLTNKDRKLIYDTLPSIAGIVETNDPLIEAQIYIKYKTKMFEKEQNNNNRNNTNIIDNLKKADGYLTKLMENNNDLNKEPLDLDDITLEEISLPDEIKNINFKTEMNDNILKKIEKNKFIEQIKKMFTGNEYVTLEFDVTTKDNKVDSITSLKYKNDIIDPEQANKLLLSSDKTAVTDEGQSISDARSKAITGTNVNKDPFLQSGGKSKRNRVKYHKTTKKKISMKRY